MMAWISVHDVKPKTLTHAAVINTKGWMLTPVTALYYPDRDVWVLYNPESTFKYTLEVTHYIALPDPPR